MKRVARLSTALAGLALAASPALAGELPLGASVAPRNASFSKSDAILGGAPSRLASILANQGAVAPAPASAGYGAAYRPFQAAFPRIVPDDRPDVFGSTALRIGRTPLDARWQRVERTPIGAAATAFLHGLDGLTEIERIDAVNRYVNARVEFTNDSTQFGSADLWLAAAETLRRGRGDCEDYAIAKLQMLRALGVPTDDLFLVIARDLVRRQDHALLAVRAGGQMWILDSGGDAVLRAEQVSDYLPLISYSGSRSWIHGRRATSSVMMADAGGRAPIAAR
jgi:predicted transglutaminase-like cysteine proteinase